MTNRGPRVRFWCVTFNNPDTADGDRWRAIIDDQPEDITFFVYQYEVGETGTNHYQGYLEWTTCRRLTQVKRLLGNAVHAEPRRATGAAAARYCRKEEGRIAGPWECGTICEPRAGQGKRNDLLAVQETIKDGMATGKTLDQLYGELEAKHFPSYVRYFKSLNAVVANHYVRRPIAGRGFDPIRVDWFWGGTGTGKTRTAFEAFDYSCYRKDGATKWWDGYRGEANVVIDDLSANVDFGLLLGWTDRYSNRVEIKGGYVSLTCTWIIITCPVHPRNFADVRGGSTDQLIRRLCLIREMVLQPNDCRTEFGGMYAEINAGDDWDESGPLRRQEAGALRLAAGSPRVTPY